MEIFSVKRFFASTFSRVKWSKDNVAMSTLPCPDWTTVLGKLSFTDFLLSSPGFAQQPHDKLAIVDETGNFRTFGHLKQDVTSFREFAQHELGLKKGDVMTFISPNHLDYFSVVHGFSSAGVTVSPLNPQYTRSEIEFQLRASGSKTLVAHKSCLFAALEAAHDCKIPHVLVLEDDGQESHTTVRITSLSKIRMAAASSSSSTEKKDPPFAVAARGKDVVLLPFSSGTTGLPKGTMLTHDNLIANLVQLEHPEGRFFGPKEVVISPLPFFHIYGFTVSLNFSLFQGKTLVTSERKFDLETFCQQVERFRCTRAHLVPPIVLSLSKSALLVKKYDMSSLKCIMSAAAPLGAELEASVKDVLPSLINCKQAWGMTELSPIGTCVEDDGNVFAGSVGPPVCGTEVRIASLTPGGGGDDSLPPDTEGELQIRGPQVMLGYFNNEEKTREVLTQDGWLRTGDIAKMNAQGFVFITDRLKELIKVRGFQVAPAELEAVLLTHPLVLDAVVIPRPHDEAGEVPRAYVVLQPCGKEGSISEEELVHWMDAQDLVYYKRLKGGVKFVDKIPKTASGKILRRQVVAMDREMFPL